MDTQTESTNMEARIARTATAPRVTPDQLEDTIVGTFYFTAADGAALGSWMSTQPESEVTELFKNLNLLTFCVLVLKNGFTVTGESACADPANFNAELGRDIARKNAVDKMWPLLGYELKTKLSAEA